jgi:hypothetical protein
VIWELCGTVRLELGALRRQMSEQYEIPVQEKETYIRCQPPSFPG